MEVTLGTGPQKGRPATPYQEGGCNMGKLEGKVAVITGGTAGIGVGITQVYLEEGAKVVFCGRREEKGRELERGYRDAGHDATFVRCDMTVEEDVQNLLDTAVATYGKVDILVNNAGVMHPFSISNMDMAADYDAVMNVNIRAYFLATKLFSNVIGKGGSIVNIASVVGRMGNVGQANYSASKAGIVGLTKATARELAPKGITCNAVAPGFIRTDMTKNITQDNSELLRTIPLGRMGDVSDVA